MSKSKKKIKLSKEAAGRIFNREYICHECGAKMKFTDDFEDELYCPKCNHTVMLDRYGYEDLSDEDFIDTVYPLRKDIDEDYDPSDEEYEEYGPGDPEFWYDIDD